MKPAGKRTKRQKWLSKITKRRKKQEAARREKFREIDRENMHYNPDYFSYDQTTPNTPTYRR